LIKKRQNGFHAFRHAAGSLLYEITHDLQMAKEFLRHTRISTTPIPIPMRNRKAGFVMLAVFSSRTTDVIMLGA
jgi:integrase